MQGKAISTPSEACKHNRIHSQMVDDVLVVSSPAHRCDECCLHRWLLLATAEQGRSYAAAAVSEYALHAVRLSVLL
jgi:hypothetical protein